MPSPPVSPPPSLPSPPSTPASTPSKQYHGAVLGVAIGLPVLAAVALSGAWYVRRRAHQGTLGREYVDSDRMLAEPKRTSDGFGGSREISIPAFIGEPSTASAPAPAAATSRRGSATAPFAAMAAAVGEAASGLHRRLSSVTSRAAAGNGMPESPLEAECRKAEATEPLTEAAVKNVQDAIEAAEAQGCDVLVLNPARRRLKQLEERLHARMTQQVRGKLGDTLAAIDAAAKQGSSPSARAVSLLVHVYRTHPPKTASVNQAALDALLEAGGSQSAPLKKALLKAQRDYHPDRNKDLLRATLDINPEEWEVLSSAICQQLTTAYDRVFKGEREYDEDEER